MDSDSFPIRLPRDIGILATPGWIVTETPAWIGHMPFAFWIVSAAEPRVLAELGCHYGNSYFAFAQAVRDCGLSTLAFAIDTWVGDEHSGEYGPEVFDSVNDFNEQNYSTFSQIVRSTFDEARDHFEDGAVDLLHIDGHHSYEAVRHDFETWLPKMSDRGIVLFHDIAVRERGFGVHRLWAELAEQHESFAFEHGHGLGVLSVGSRVPKRVRALFALGADSEEATAVNRLFATLGRRLVLEASLDGRLAVARAEGEEALAVARAEGEEALAVARAEGEEALAVARAEHAAVLEEASQEHATAIDALKVESDQMVSAAQIKADLAAERAAKVFDQRLGSIVDGKAQES